MKTTKVTPAQAKQIVKLISIDLQNKSCEEREDVCFKLSKNYTSYANTLDMHYTYMTRGTKTYRDTYHREVLNGKQFKTAITNCPLRFMKQEQRYTKNGNYRGIFFTVDYAALIMCEKGRELLALAQQDAETNLAIR